MRAKFLFLITAVILFITNNGYTQITLPKVMPMSPTASSLYKFTDYPVSLNTGLVDISVPIYTIEADGFNVPISLKYHASGIKYDDVSRNVGLGWTLMAGGMITAQQMGVPDNTYPGFFKLAANVLPEQTESPANNLPTDGENNDHHKLIEVAKGLRDSEYDIYSYSFLNYSGKFFYPGTTDPVFSPRRNLKVTAGTAFGVGMYHKFPFTILDEDGVSYKFGMDRNNNTISENPLGTSSACINFMLTEIVSADKSDTVLFKYSGVSTFQLDQLYRRMDIDNQMVLFDNLENRGYTGSLPSDHPDGYGVSFQGFGYERLDEITFKGGKVVFSYNANQQLTEIKVFSNTASVPVKTVTILQSTFTTDYYKLDEVKFNEQGVSTPRTYSYKFNYNDVPYEKWSGIDYWGYYNGVDKSTVISTGYVPNFSFLNSSWPAIGAADRRPNEEAMKKGMLTKVTYPTSGYSVFTYEAHRYGTGQIAGGLRIKSIENFSESGVSTGQKWYKYGGGETGNGTLFRNIDPNDYCYTFQNEGVLGPVENITYILRERRYSSFPIISIMSSLGSSVTYGMVTEYTGDGTTANGKTVYQYESFPDNTYGSPEPMNGPIPMTYRSNAWKTGNLLSKGVYKQDGTLLSYTTNVYKDLNYVEYPCLKVMQYLNWIDYGEFSTNYMTRDQKWEYFLTRSPLYGITWGSGGGVYPYPGVYLHSPYSYADYLLSSGLRVLDYTTEANDGVTRTTTYTYDSTYDKPRTVTTTESNGTPRVQRLTYPFDKGSTTPYPGMVTANIINPVIDQEEYKTNTSNFLKSTITDWDSWSGVYKPKTVSTKTGTAPAEVRIRYSGYDAKGNVQTVAKEGGPKTTYIWSYQGTYPVAEIQNADYSTVETALGGATAVNNFRNSNPTDAALISFLAPLRTATSLKDAMVTTYTYQPLVGATSTTDPKGLTTYYEYDGFNRLNIIRDKDGNIVKAICYNYKGEPTTNCYVPSSRNIYAKIELSNYTPSGTDPDYYTHADLRLKFYADAACTQPFYFGTATSISAAINRATFNDIDNSTTNTVTGSVSFTVAANQSSSPPVSQLTHHLHTYEYDGYYFGDTESYTFTINTPTTGNLFVAAN